MQNWAWFSQFVPKIWEPGQTCFPQFVGKIAEPGKTFELSVAVGGFTEVPKISPGIVGTGF